MVRRCFHKATGKAYAVKIIDKLSDAGGTDIEATTREEVLILLSLQGHENISKKFFVYYLAVTSFYLIRKREYAKYLSLLHSSSRL